MLRAVLLWGREGEGEKAHDSRTETLNDKSLIYWNDEDLIAVRYIACLLSRRASPEIVYDILMQ